MKRRTRIVLSARPLLLLAGLFTLLAGCAGLGVGDVMRSPGVNIVGAELTNSGLEGADVLFEFEVDNPNGVALVLDGLDYRLRLNDRPLLDGRQDERTQIAARSESRVDLPVRIRYVDLLRVLETLDGDDSPSYEIQADFQFAVPVLGSITVPVTRKGELSLDRFLRSRLGR